jgi:hypothetical protein
MFRPSSAKIFPDGQDPSELTSGDESSQQPTPIPAEENQPKNLFVAEDVGVTSSGETDRSTLSGSGRYSVTYEPHNEPVLASSSVKDEAQSNQQSQHHRPSVVTSPDAEQTADVLLNYLSFHIDAIKGQENDSLVRFEQLIEEAIQHNADPTLRRILKMHGWTGKSFNLPGRYSSSSSHLPSSPVLTQDLSLSSYGEGDMGTHLFDPEHFLQALTNFYLTQKARREAEVEVEGGTGDSGIYATGSDYKKITSFVPNILLNHIRTVCGGDFDGEDDKVREEEGGDTAPLSPLRVSSTSFQGAAMLVDISGFSTFAGKMCSKGVKGLNDLHGATNGFLGYFVDTVAEYGGDGKKALATPCRLLTSLTFYS